jgi:hypothetical protein
MTNGASDEADWKRRRRKKKKKKRVREGDDCQETPEKCSYFMSEYSLIYILQTFSGSLPPSMGHILKWVTGESMGHIAHTSRVMCAFNLMSPGHHRKKTQT